MEMPMNDKIEIFNFLQGVEFFSKLDKKALWPLANVAVQRHFKANEILIKENSEPVGIFILQKGKVQVYTTSKDGSEHVLAELGPGQFFGEVSVMDKLNTTASVRVLADIDCYFISAWDFNIQMNAYPEIALQFIPVLNHWRRVLMGK